MNYNQIEFLIWKKTFLKKISIFSSIMFLIMLLPLGIIHLSNQSSDEIQKEILARIIVCCLSLYPVIITITICGCMYLSTWSKIVKRYIGGISIIATFLVGFPAILQCSADMYVEEPQKAAKCYEIMKKYQFRKFTQYGALGQCYYNTRDIDKAIENWQIAYSDTKHSSAKNFALLTDLYLIKGNLEKVIERDDMYKISLLKENWQDAIHQINFKIKNDTRRISFDKKTKYYWHYDVYLARAFANKKLNNLEEANNDLEIAIKIAPDNLTEKIKTQFNSENYFKEYYLEQCKYFNVKAQEFKQ